MLPNVGMALVMFVVCVCFYSRNLMGGGDAKLLTVAFLVGRHRLCSGFCNSAADLCDASHIAARSGWVDSQLTEDERIRISFAPSVAAALMGIFMLGCLAPTR